MSSRVFERRFGIALVFAVTAVGCGFFEPVVAKFSSEGIPEGMPCDPPPPCDALQAARPAPITIGERFDETASDCEAPRTVTSMVLTEDTTLDAEELTCTDLTVDVEGTADDVRVLRVVGSSLWNARLHVHTASPSVQLVIEVDRVSFSEVLTDGPVTTTLDDVHTNGSRFVLTSPPPLAAPSLVVDEGALSNVQLFASGAAVQLRKVHATHASLDVRSLVVERGAIDGVEIEAGFVALLTVSVSASVVSADELEAAAGDFQNVYFARCGSLSLSHLGFARSFIPVCDEPVEFMEVAVTESTIAADVIGSGGSIRHSTFGGSFVSLDGGEITDTALCGTSAVDALLLECVRCEPTAPPDVCATIEEPQPFCPGLCTSRCAETGATPLDADACSP